MMAYGRKEKVRESVIYKKYGIVTLERTANVSVLADIFRSDRTVVSDCMNVPAG